MNVKTKKLVDSKVHKMEVSGEIKEVIIHPDLVQEEKNSVRICFRGNRSSGIVELSTQEANDLNKTLTSKLSFLKEVKVFKEKV
jgi:hypothetical protein